MYVLVVEIDIGAGSDARGRLNNRQRADRVQIADCSICHPANQPRRLEIGPARRCGNVDRTAVGVARRNGKGIGSRPEQENHIAAYGELCGRAERCLGAPQVPRAACAACRTHSLVTSRDVAGYRKNFHSLHGEASATCDVIVLPGEVESNGCAAEVILVFVVPSMTRSVYAIWAA